MQKINCNINPFLFLTVQYTPLHSLKWPSCYSAPPVNFREPCFVGGKEQKHANHHLEFWVIGTQELVKIPVFPIYVPNLPHLSNLVK